MTTIYLIRHAEAEGNVFRRLQGQYDSMLTPNGRRQVAALEGRFADIPVHAVYASDLTRTCLTAGAIYKPKGLALHREPRFREISVGTWENLPFGWLDRERHELMWQFSHSPQTWRVEGSEPFEVYTARFLQALDEAAQRHDGQTIAIFSHGMVMRGALQTLFFPGEDGAVGHGDNTSVACLHWENGRYTLDYFNDASHLPPEISTLGRQLWWRGDGKKDFNMWFRDATAEDAPLFSALGIAPEGRVSVLGETPVGAVVYHKTDEMRGELCFLGLLPEHRGIGLAAQLLGEAISRLRDAGVREIILREPVQDAAAARLFAEYGFSGTPASLCIVPTAD